MNNAQTDVFEQKIKQVMAAHPGVAPHRDIGIPLEPLQDLADALEQALGVPGLTFIVDATYNLGLVSVVALIGSSNRPVWRLTAHCADNDLLRPSLIAKPKPFTVMVFSGLVRVDADKPGDFCRDFKVECDDLTGLADYLMQYVDDARFGAEMIALRKIAHGARGEKPGGGSKPRQPQVDPTIDLGQGDPRVHALRRLQEAVEDAIAEVPSTAALLDESVANLRDAINIAKIVDADLYSFEAAQNVLWSIEHMIAHKKRFDVHLKDALEGAAEVSSSMELELIDEDGKRL